MSAVEARSSTTVQRVTAGARRTFRSLGTRNYRLFFGGELVSHTGSWMQTMAEAWLVLTLTHSGLAVGATFAFRFLPVLLFGLWGGVIADRFDRRRILLITQSLAALLAIALWLIVATGVVQTWMVFALAIGLGLVTVVDQPAQQAFIEEIVGYDQLPNAIALQNAVANSARITGPAIAGLLIGSLGVAPVFLVNAISFVAVLVALKAMRRGELRPVHPSVERPRVRQGLAYAWSITEIRATVLLVAVVGTLVYNFPTFLTLLARNSFHGGASLAGMLMAVLGGGTVLGALFAAIHSAPTKRTVVVSAALLGAALLGAATVPTRAALVVALVPVGALAVFFGSTANAHLQIWSAPQFRGRVMAIYSLLTLGSTVVGGPFIGWVCQHWSARFGFGVAGGATMGTALAVALVARLTSGERALTTEALTPSQPPEPLAELAG
jgi:MFS family permease